ncbi:Imm51 family immunity protein [Fulvivirga ligni]|uniref:Imm51 family immunity protein n=1 Tax=Fulvivirga ligni TaxID=2904246 RepID=UPI001F395F0C|nr:Imm51 family immunity protein [Fulvivirga ligni]UII20723.1 immunity 51 family protein [Fulvivirga ligni]
MKNISTLLIPLLLIACQQFEPEPKLVNALTDESISIRGNIVEIDERTYRLDYYDVHEPDSHYEQLSSRGFQGGGPTWLGITYGAIKLSNPELLDNIRFDDEAEGLAIWSSSRSTLEQIGRLISTVKSDEQLLNICIQVAEANWKME